MSYLSYKPSPLRLMSSEMLGGFYFFPCTAYSLYQTAVDAQEHRRRRPILQNSPPVSAVGCKVYRPTSKLSSLSDKIYAP